MSARRTLAVIMVNPSIAKGGNAVFSPCGTFRYRLERDLDNPAPDQENDPTIGKVEGFARRAGFNLVLVGNLFALVSTDIKGLRAHPDPRGGRENLEHLARMIGEADAVMFAWGPTAKVPKQWRNRWTTVVDLARRAGKQPLCLGICGDGQPRHPLMVPYAQAMEPWTAPR